MDPTHAIREPNCHKILQAHNGQTIRQASFSAHQFLTSTLRFSSSFLLADFTRFPDKSPVVGEPCPA